MAGGTAVIVGGGALLGFVTGGTASAASLALLSAPEYVVIECAKIEVAIQEILIKSLNDVSGAKSVLEKFKDGIDSLDVRRHIVGGANRTLISVETPLQLCRIGTCRRLSAGCPQIVVALFEKQQPVLLLK